MYTIKIKSGKYNGKKFYLYVKRDENNKLKYGDLIELIGEYLIPSDQRNYKGFNYREYLRTKKIYGSIKATNDEVKLIERDKLNPILLFSNKFRNSIIDKSKSLLSKETSSLLIGMLDGSEEIKVVKNKNRQVTLF